ncbi:BAG family molecular chaperone regulator 2 [Holothuria leucospilota]|uniref:BAG family molecular chaperone regulator 2 n=1 Tax=Holothuria leucospilota TaxID=206669 RepID=A0A9Q1BTK1_HOLLE|nr:BAG family molecular chaperone regulator 2 [Holothuria leucospilota]
MANNRQLSLVQAEDLTHEKIQETLDSLENGVDRMRELARLVRDDKETILSSLGALLNSPVLKETKGAEREELELRLDNLVKRCLSIEISVETIRNPNQELAFQRIRELMSSLVESAHSDLRRSKDTTERYLNSCLADPRGPVDERFQATLLECTAEDQKEVRKKLQDFLDRMEKANGLLSTFDPKLP